MQMQLMISSMVLDQYRYFRFPFIYTDVISSVSLDHKFMYLLPASTFMKCCGIFKINLFVCINLFLKSRVAVDLLREKLLVGLLLEL